MFLLQEFNINLSYAGSRHVSIFLQDCVILKWETALDTFIILFVYNCRFFDYLLSAKNVMSLSEINSKQKRSYPAI